MLDELKGWIEALLGSSWVYSAGMWTDRPGIYNSPICSIQNDGGPQPDVDDRRPRFRVILLSPIVGPGIDSEGGPHVASPSVVTNVSAAHAVRVAAEMLVIAATQAAPPCGAAHIRISEPTGPGTTAENRRWYALGIEIIF